MLTSLKNMITLTMTVISQVLLEGIQYTCRLEVLMPHPSCPHHQTVEVLVQGTSLHQTVEVLVQGTSLHQTVEVLVLLISLHCLTVAQCLNGMIVLELT